MTDLTVAEEVVLIALDNENGAGKNRFGLDWVIAGAVIAELVLARRIAIDNAGVLTVLDPTPTGQRHLDTALDTVLATVARGGGTKIGTALRRTHRGGIKRTVGALVDRGVLREKRVWLIGALPIRRYPAVETGAEFEIRDRLSRTVLAGHTPDERTAALIAVLHAGKLWREAVPAGDRRRVKRRMGDIAEDQFVSHAIRKAIVQVRRRAMAMAAVSSNHG